MRILAQNYGTGELQMLEVPMITSGNGLLVETRASLVSVGTEKAMIDVAKKSLLGKALARPDWVKQVIEKVKTEGLMEAWRQSKARLEMPVPLGYSCAGIIRDLNRVDEDFHVGDMVACSGSGYASHAEYNVVPSNLCVRIPENVSFEDASYVAVGGIAMEAVRLAKTEFGYKVGVIGLGLLGQLAVQILKAAGCHVIGIDLSEKKCSLALESGAESVALIGRDDPVAISKGFSDGQGLDAVIIFASTESNEPLNQAANMCRERGRIIAGGLIGLDIPRKIFYEKELDFAVSRAWGPGMYDPDYEERNIKYPLPFVRWTAKRNMEEFLRMVSFGTVKTSLLTTHKFPFDKSLTAYEMMLTGKEQAIGVILQYPEKNSEVSGELKRIDARPASGKVAGRVGVGLIGAGLFARGTLLPALKKIPDLALVGVATSRGLSASAVAKSEDFQYAASDYKEILKDESVNLVFILTRHNSHARFVCEALREGKSVFVEKPLCINPEQLREIIDTYSSVVTSHSSAPFLMVGFNRRFAPTTRKCIEFIGRNRKSSVVQIRCNAGFIPPDSWVHKINEGGGRIIGEVCHFIDLAQAITDGLPKRIFASAIEDPQGLRDSLTISMKMDNGAVAGIIYASNGDKSFSREEVQVFAGGSVSVIDNFRNIHYVSAGKARKEKSIEVDRGYVEEIRTTIDAVRDGKISPIDFRSLVATTIATFAIEESITKGESIEINLREWGIN